MPSPTTIDEFLELVRKSTVADEKRLTTHVDKLRATGALPAEPAQLAGALVRDGILTHFQAEQLLQGKWRRFSIGKYKVLERLGAGGMGSVYLCEHKLMRRRVALKVLPTAKAEDPPSLERFYREARAVAALDHPNIVRAYDIDQEDKLHFLVMEHVDGASLQEMVKKTGPMDVIRACHYMRQAAQGLQHAHETAGLVHRDIKPGNILVDRSGTVKILDMGLARFFHDEDDILTKKYDENVLGTADYLAPEQALDSHSVDIRADIYSLGATFYFCLTARTPFAEGSVAQKLIWHQTRQPKPIRSLRPEVPEGVVAVIDRMMAKDPAQRYQMPSGVVEALATWTQTPIPPPPDSEMPQFSPAAMGTSPTEGNAGAPSRPTIDASLSPRRVWQVPATPPSGIRPSQDPQAAAGVRLPPAAPPAPTFLATPLQRKTTPPPSSYAEPTVTGAAVPTPRPTPVPPTPPRPAPGTSAAKPAANGPPRAPTRGVQESRAETAGTAVEEAETAWEQLGTDDNSSVVRAVRASPSGSRKAMARWRQSAAKLVALLQEKPRYWWVLAGAAAVCFTVILVLWLALRSQQEPAPAAVTMPPPFVLFVSSDRQGDDVVSSLGAALERLRKRAKPGGRIILQKDLAEEVMVSGDLAGLTIESEEGHRYTWQAPVGAAGGKLLLLYSARGFHIRRLTFDGGGQEESLLVLSGNCAGTTLEDVTLRGFQKEAVRVINCMGGPAPNQNVSLLRLAITTDKPEQSGFLFDLQPGLKPSFPTNEHVLVADCTVDGPARVKVKATAPDAYANVQIPLTLGRVVISQ